MNRRAVFEGSCRKERAAESTAATSPQIIMARVMKLSGGTRRAMVSGSNSSDRPGMARAWCTLVMCASTCTARSAGKTRLSGMRAVPMSASRSKATKLMGLFITVSAHSLSRSGAEVDTASSATMLVRRLITSA